MKDILLDRQTFTATAFREKDKETDNRELERAEHCEITDLNFFQMQREAQQILKELPKKRDEALRCYADIVKSARPELYPEGAVQKKG